MWQHIKLSKQIRSWGTLACCWDVKQHTDQQTNLMHCWFTQLEHRQTQYLSESRFCVRFLYSVVPILSVSFDRFSSSCLWDPRPGGARTLNPHGQSIVDGFQRGEPHTAHPAAPCGSFRVSLIATARTAKPAWDDVLHTSRSRSAIRFTISARVLLWRNPARLHKSVVRNGVEG